MTFHKYQGTGNDFIVLDDRARRFADTDQPRIGAGGLMLLRDKAGY